MLQHFTPSQVTSLGKRAASRSPTPRSSQKRRVTHGLEEGSVSNSANNNVFSGSIGNFQSYNTVTTNITYTGQYPELRKFLSPLDPETRHRTVREKLTKGTGEWLLNSPRFRRWKQAKGPQVLCLLGDPGVGKTSLFCQVIENLRSEEQAYRAIISSVYCDYVDQERYTAHNLIGALLSQIITHLEPKKNVIKKLTERHKHCRYMTTEELTESLFEAAESGGFETIWLCLDALDELDVKERDKLLRSMAIIRRRCVFRIFLTGRSNAGVATSIDQYIHAASSLITVDYYPFSVGGISKDIQHFLEEKLREDGDPSLMDDKLRKAIFRHLTGPGSTFLVAALNIGKILKGKTARKREQALSQIALNLDDCYEEMMTRIKRQDEDYGMRILHWILFAARALRVEELRYAVAIEPGIQDFDPKMDLPSASILHSTLGLVTVDKERVTGKLIVRLVHLTFKEHLLRNSLQYFPSGHALLAEAALTYLTLDATHTEEGRMRYTTRSGDLHRFYYYARRYWADHVRQREDEDVVERVYSILNSDKFPSFKKTIFERQQLDLPVHTWLPVHLVSYFGLPSSLQRLLDSHSQMEDTLHFQNATGQLVTSLQPEVVDTTKHDREQKCMVVNASDIEGWTPLTLAVRSNRIKVVEQLLKRKDVYMNLPGKDGMTPLFLAINRHGFTQPDSIAKWLIERRDVDVNLADSNDWTPLLRAVHYGRIDIVVNLLERKEIDVNFPCVDGRTPLLVAVEKGVTDIVTKLLRREEIDVNFACDDGLTPLLVAVHRGETIIITQLLEREKTDVNCACDDGRTPLLVAVHKGSCKTVTQLLERRDVNVNAVDVNGSTPLLLALKKGHIDIVNRLLERGDVDVNAADKKGSTALSVALNKGYVEIAKQLLERKEIDMDPADKEGWILLIAVCEARFDMVQQRLGAKDININVTDCRGLTPLHIAVWTGHIEILDLLLLRKDIDVNLAANGGQIPLLVAVDRNQITIVTRLLKQKGIDVNIADNNLRTPLLVALDKDYREIAKCLLARKDVNVNIMDNQGRTPLLIAAETGNIDTAICLLQKRDIDVNSADRNGRTPLQVAGENGHLEIVKRLLEREATDRIRVYGDYQMIASLVGAGLCWRRLEVGSGFETEQCKFVARTTTGVTKTKH